jgi:hypothetical protein
MVLGQFQGQIDKLPDLSKYNYENIFRLYNTQNNQYYYNLLQSIYVDGEIDNNKVFYMTVKDQLPWSIISYNAYGTTLLWWLIALVNNIYNPVISPAGGTVLKIIRPQYLPDIIDEINRTLTR